MSEEQKKVRKEGQVTLTQMLKALDKDVAGGIEKRLKKLSKKKLLKAPLDKNKASQVARKHAYEEVTKEISSWDPIVEQNRRAKHLTFPLDIEPEVLPSTAESLGELKPNNDFEKELLGTIESSSSVLHDKKEFSKAEEKYLKAISVEEAQERHKELQKMRVLLNSYGAKMRRQKAIKSKSYHRLLKHEKIRSHMKKVESDKDLLLDEIDRLQRLRAKERASLKHKNTGKWAKHAKFRAKYDEEARKAMLEQIGIAEKFLEKPADAETDSESDEESGNELVDDEMEGEAEVNVTLNADKQAEASNSKVLDEIVMGGELDEEEDDQRKLMGEAFADDDIVAEFEKAKDEEKPKDVDLFLPGWGDWTGPGTRINKRKRKKYIIKAEKTPRRDDTLANVIISERADDKLKEMMVQKLPRGIKNDKQLAKRLTKPTAATFINQSVHRESVRPRIETKMGARIEPLSQKVSRGGNKAKWA